MRKNIPVFLSLLFLISCASSKAMIMPSRATITNETAAHRYLTALPKPKTPIVVAVYNFADKTGQYKDSPDAQTTNFSTAVTQGATSMLIKALEDSGWFVILEREGLGNLLNERKIITSTRAQYTADGETPQNLPPLLYAAINLEGGIISYDSDIVTGGAGVKYLGIGGSVQTRQDQVTIYLRATSVKNGKILRTVSVSKRILSVGVDMGFFRFVRPKSLLEIETGYTTNEPAQMCVQEAIDKAVFDLITEGIIHEDWPLKNPEDIKSVIFRKYLEEKGGGAKKM